MPIHKRVVYLVCVVAAFTALTLFNRQALAFDNGSVVEREIHAASLQHSKIGTDSLRKLLIYLPAGYATSHQQYPVVYMLLDPMEEFARHSAAKVFDQAIAAKTIPPCIFVVADFSTPLGPSWYTNSSVTGNWDDFAVKELVPYIDTNFRTLARSSSRAIIGNFIGGYGALRLAILHPDVFGTVYAMHPVGTGSGVEVFTSRPDWALLEHAGSLAQVKNAGFSTLFLSMFQAFLPNPAKAPLYVDLPVEETAGNFLVNAERMRQLRSRFFIAELVPQHLEQIKQLRAIKIDWPRNDSIYDHVYANQALTHLLNEYGIEHEAEEFNGIGDDAYWGKSSRMTKEVLPFLAEHLETGQQ
ncbi:MAG: alpha/beta hydrolase-fold protein [Acidobacteriaceae bacterium]